MIMPFLRAGLLLAAMACAAGPAAAAQDFTIWLQELRAEARAAGIGDSTLDAALAGVKPIPRVIELDRRQPERTITFATYLDRVVTPKRIERARTLYQENKALLEAVGRDFGVQPRFIVALWGIETDFGRNMGGFRVVEALATLAHDGRRSAYFREELLAALRILADGHVSADKMLGSWAGAMGQCQFMPSSFVKYAIDRDGDGRRDIWGTRADVFASAAKYLSTVGWNPDQTWGREVKLPAKGVAETLVGLTVRKPLAEWGRLGLRRIDGTGLPRLDVQASLIQPDGPKGRAFLVYDNYRTLMDWNRSTYFGTAVGILADHIGAGR